MNPKDWLEIKKLKRKVKRLEKDCADYRKRYVEQYNFSTAFWKFYQRFKSRKWDSQWPIQRVEEALRNLEEKRS